MSKIIYVLIAILIYMIINLFIVIKKIQKFYILLVLFCFYKFFYCRLLIHISLH